MTMPLTRTSAIEVVDCEGRRVMVPLYALAIAHERLTEQSYFSGIEQIQHMVGRHFGLTVEALRSSRREKHLVRARHIAMYLAHEITELSTPQIGRRFGDRDHSSVLHGIKRVRDLLGTDAKVKADVEFLRAQIRAKITV
jgi:chromosomal replication initiator protein